MNKTTRGKLHNLIYLAGIIDGEGCLGISKNSTKKQRQKNPKYQSEVCVVNTNHALMDWLQNKIGGLVNARKNYQEETWKTAYRWRIKEGQHSTLLKSILPYLIIKKKQAELIIEFQETKKLQSLFGRELSDEQKDTREFYYQSLKKLNAKGSARRD